MDKIKRIIFFPPLLGAYFILILFMSLKGLIVFRKKRAKKNDDEVNLDHVI